MYRYIYEQYVEYCIMNRYIYEQYTEYYKVQSIGRDPCTVLCRYIYVKYCTVQQGGVIFIFLIGQKTALHQSGIILEVQIQIFEARAAKFSFSKNPGGLNINIYL